MFSFHLGSDYVFLVLCDFQNLHQMSLTMTSGVFTVLLTLADASNILLSECLFPLHCWQGANCLRTDLVICPWTGKNSKL